MPNPYTPTATRHATITEIVGSDVISDTAESVPIEECADNAEYAIAQHFARFDEDTAGRILRTRTGANADESTGIATEDVLLVTTLTATRTYTLEDAPTAAKVEWRAANAVGSGGTVELRDPGASLLFTLAAGTWCHFVWTGSAWFLIAQGTLS